MSSESLMRWPDLVVIGLNLAVMVAIGIYCARKTRSADAYFLADRSMPGWVVGFSLMATLISSMTFLAIPAVTYAQDWRYIPAHVLYIFPAILGYFVFLPFFRRGHVRSAYEYLELRYGTWARLYGAVSFLLYHLFRVGIILYVVSLAVETMTGYPMPAIILILGVLIATYAVAGGLQAVIYTDFLQGLALMIGGLICLPVILNLLPGGLTQIFSEAYDGGKFGFGETEWAFDKETVWVLILVYQFEFLRLVCADQTMVQRYVAMKTDREARRGYILGIVLIIPVWIYFALLGTAIFVLHRHLGVVPLEGAKPEQVIPQFLLTHVPAGLAGIGIAGLLASAMSTLDSSINSSAATVTTDFYRRFRPLAGDERHYLRVGRALSLVFSVLMIGVALWIHHSRTKEGTLMDLQTIIYPIVNTGLLSMFLLGFLTVRVKSRAALIATAGTVLLVVAWVFLTTDTGQQLFPKLTSRLPNRFWIGVLPHLFLLAIGYLLSFVLPRSSDKDLENLTIWTKSEEPRK